MAKKKRPPKGTARKGISDKYTSRERCIFRYWDGSRQVAADPLQIQAALLEVPDIDADTRLACLQSEAAQGEARKAFGRLVEKLRPVFGVEAFRTDDAGKEHGLTSAETVDLLRQFSAFMADLKKKADTLRTSATPTAQESCPDGSATPNTSGSTSTGTGYSTGELSASPPA